MAAILGIIKSLQLDNLSSKFVIKDTNLINRLSYKVTPKVIVYMLLLVIYLQYVNPPMICWYASTQSIDWKEYINSYCWSESFYHPAIKINNTRVPDMSRLEHATFQWVPFVLGTQILFFYIPCLLWEAIFVNSPINISDIFKTALSANNQSPGEDRAKMVAQLRETFKQYIKRPKLNPQMVTIGGEMEMLEKKADDVLLRDDSRKQNSKIPHEMVNRQRGNILMFTDYLVKVAYIINAFGQIIFVCYIFGYDSVFFGIKSITNMILQQGTEIPYIFPRVVYCMVDFEDEKNTEKVMAKCSIRVNMYNEKIFTFLWFWCLVIGIAECISFISKIYSDVRATGEDGFVRNNLRLLRQQYSKESRNNALIYTRKNMRRDGIFILHTISNQVSRLLSAEIVIELWKASLHPPTQFLLDNELDDQDEKQVQDTKEL